MRTAVVGCGTIAAEYGPALADAPEVDLVAATDLDAERAATFGADHDCASFSDLDAMLDAATPELVVNLTIHDAHAPVTRRCLDAGRHVYSEKPLALDASTAWELVELADARGVELGCAPANRLGDAQRLAGRSLRDGSLGRVRTGSADCHIGRLTEWHSNPEPFLRVGPLLDGAVYPLSLLAAYFGPVRLVETAHASRLLREHAHDGRTFEIETPDHVVAVLRFDAGVEIRLTASAYVPYQTKRFNSLELHGDGGSLFLRNCGETGAPTDRPAVEFARLGREYVPVRPQHDPRPRDYADGVRDLVAAVNDERSPVASGRLAAHVVSVAEAIGTAAETGSPTPVANPALDAAAFADRSEQTGSRPTLDADAPAVPPVGFGCSRYRGGDAYVDLDDAMERALDAGYRLFDSAELYGNEGRLGEVLARRGSPDREAVYLLSKVWNTNHRPEHVREACRTTREQLGVDALDCYMLHWPDAWTYQGPLVDLAERSHEDLASLAFPTDADGNPIEADVPLSTTWRAMEGLVSDGAARSLGVSNFSVDELDDLLATARVPPAVVQFERHPYLPNRALVEWCHERGAVPMAHSPLSAPGLLAEDAVKSIAADRGVSPAQVVLRWNLERDVVPIPSSGDPDHVVANADLFRVSLSQSELASLDSLADPGFSR
ncbi:aldo/keto reductase [Haloferacaceae archaeon DSL9]